MGTCPLAAFKHALGEPGVGVHAARVFGLARFDVLGTLGLAFVTTPVIYARFRTRRVAALGASLLAWTVLAIVVHRAFCVDTALNVALLGRVGGQ